MKNFKDSFLVNAHLFIMLATFAISFGAFGVSAGHGALDDTHMAYMSYGYESVSAQQALAMNADERGLSSQDPVFKQGDGEREQGRILAGMQYAADADHTVFDTYGLQSAHLNNSRTSLKG